MSEPIDRREELFHKALALPAAERRAFLEQACAGNAALASNIDALLRAYAESEFLESPPLARPPDGAEPRSWEQAPALELTGKRVGRYKLLEEIGEGGCGVVYLAEQEEPIRRRVALKVIKIGMDTREVIARFEAERQALAMMDHPNIARVFDCGATEGGRPFFVMELVRGPPITAYCEDRCLPISARLELFIPVCRAIQHAHERGVIHRDIKPSNILVAESDGAPLPKVIDFGVAKAVEARLTEKSLHTVLTQFIGTPAYMSPEQAELKTGMVDARSDVYSLGILLYELLTGQTPFAAQDLADSGLEEMRRRIREEDPPQPSEFLTSLDGKALAMTAQRRKADPSKLARQLRGDLDHVVMHCIEKNPTSRYATAVALAEDIRRYLRHEPVTAAAPRLGATLRNWTHRNRSGLIGTVAVLATFGIATAVAWIWFGRHSVTAASAAAGVIDPKSVAVLPFSNLSPDPANAFFAEGMHEDVITNLTKIHDLKVISHASVMAYGVGTRNLRAIARELGVANILEGSVERIGGRVHVTAQLVDAQTDNNIWADAYDGDLTDEFAIQSDLAQAIAGALQANLTADERRLVSRRPTLNHEAYDLYLQARAMEDRLGDNGTMAQYDQQIALYEKAAAEDPGFFLAYVQLAVVNSRLYGYARLDPTLPRLARAKAAAAAARDLEPNAPETKFALGIIAYCGSLDWNQALAEFQSAEAEMPNDSQLLCQIGDTNLRLGHWHEGLAYFERACALDPRNEAALEDLLDTFDILRRYPQVVDVAGKYAARFLNNVFLVDALVRARYEVDGNTEALIHDEDARYENARYADPIRKFFVATDHSDWAAAESALSDPQMADRHLPDPYGIIPDPVPLGRAAVARIRGEMEAARTFAAMAIAEYRKRAWTPRQKPWASMRLGLAEAYAGLDAAAVRDAIEAWNGVSGRDALDAAMMRPQLGRVYLALNRREEALAVLRSMMTEPCDWGPRKIRLDPFWSQLKDDPRFEKILSLAKPL